MSSLSIYNDSNPEAVIFETTQYSVISEKLGVLGVCFERWETKVLSNDDDMLLAYASDIERLKSENGYQSEDVVSLKPDNEKKSELRNKFLSEHTHSEDEVRFFVEGSGMFYLHVENKIYMVLCEAGDLISVPANAKHWFDMGESPGFTCIRLFTSKDGWAADYTGDNIADTFPKFEIEEKAA